LPNENCADKTGDAGIDVNDRAAGEIERRDAAGMGAGEDQAVGVPHHVGDREVDEGDPQDVNSTTAENLMRSANAPTISAGVMQAKVIWKAMKTYSGMTKPSEKVAAVESGVTPTGTALPKPPKKALVEPPKANE
jgi:hypothetical protein